MEAEQGRGLMRNTMRRNTILALTSVLLLFAGVLSCGRKGAPHPPEENAPGAVQNLGGKGAVDGILLSWQAPLENSSGENVKNLGSFVIQRRDVLGNETNRFEDVGIVELDPEALGNLKKKQFTFLDNSPAIGRRYDYIVFARTDDGLDGETNRTLRTTFRGETSIVESLAPESTSK